MSTKSKGKAGKTAIHEEDILAQLEKTDIMENETDVEVHEYIFSPEDEKVDDDAMKDHQVFLVDSTNELLEDLPNSSRVIETTTHTVLTTTQELETTTHVVETKTDVKEKTTHSTEIVSENGKSLQEVIDQLDKPIGKASADLKVEKSIEPKKEKEKEKEKEIKPKKIRAWTNEQPFKLTVETPVYSRKDIDEKPSLMRRDSDVMIKQLIDVGPTGTSIVAVRKPGSKRIFYTPSENFTNQGVVFVLSDDAREYLEMNPEQKEKLSNATGIEPSLGNPELTAILERPIKNRDEEDEEDEEDIVWEEEELEA
jgi:gas vesicle protein